MPATIFYSLLAAYRSLPLFKGKLRLGKLFFSQVLNKPDPVSFVGHHNIKYSIPDTREIIGVELLINGMYEQTINRLILSILEKGDIYFDVGANIGALGLPAIKRKKIAYHAFEASPATYEILTKNLLSNGVENYNATNAVVHEAEGFQMDFYLADEYGKSTLSNTYYNNSVKVPSVSIDAYCKEKGIKKIKLLKADVQGFEYFVFKGMKEMLFRKDIENILFENSPWAEKDAGIAEGSAQNILHDAGFTLYTVTGRKLSKGEPHNEEMIWARSYG